MDGPLDAPRSTEVVGAVQRIHDPDPVGVDTPAVIVTLLGKHGVVGSQPGQAVGKEPVGLSVTLVPEPVGGPPLSHRPIPDLEQKVPGLAGQESGDLVILHAGPTLTRPPPASGPGP